MVTHVDKAFRIKYNLDIRLVHHAGWYTLNIDCVFYSVLMLVYFTCEYIMYCVF